MSDERPQGAITVTSYTTIDDVGNIQISHPSAGDRIVQFNTDGTVWTWAPGEEQRAAAGERAGQRALRWAMRRGERP